MTRRRFSAVVVREFFQGLASEMQSIFDADKRALARNGRLDPLATGIGQGEKVSCEITAIDRGDVARVERPQIPRVIPIIEMPAEALQFSHGRKGCFQSCHRIDCPSPSEVTRRDGRQEIKAHIGGRGAVRDDRIGIFLKIIRRKHVVLGRDESLEVTPRAPRDPS